MKYIFIMFAIVFSVNAYAAKQCRPYSLKEFRLNVIEKSDLVDIVTIKKIQENKTIATKSDGSMLIIKDWQANKTPTFNLKVGDRVKLYLQQLRTPYTYILTNDSWVRCVPSVKRVK